MARRALLAPLAVLVALASGSGCGPGRGRPEWIPAGAAVVRCTVAGKHRAQAILHDVPTPPPPSGLYARLLDPLALDELGFQRDQPVCASLEAPAADQVAAAAAALTDLVAIRDEAVLDAAREVGSCDCEVARAAGLSDLVSSCRGAPHRADCAPTREQVAALAAALAPVDAALARTPWPLVHWRLSGAGDRPGWFTRHAAALMARHPSGSDPWFRGAAIPPGPEYDLVRVFAARPEVVAVVRQDAGAAHLVIRELGDDLVVDHLAHAPLGARLEGLRDRHPVVRPEDYLALLDAPSTPFEPTWDPREGDTVEFDVAALGRLDTWAVALARAGGALGTVRDDTRDAAVARVAVRAPYGRDGTRLEATLHLSDAGRTWAQLLPGTPLSPTLDELSLPELEPEPPSTAPPRPFLHDTAVARFWTHPVAAAAPALRAMERSSPQTIRGRPMEFELTLASGPLPADVPQPPQLARLFERLASTPHLVRGRFDKRREQLQLELLPR